MNVNSTVKKLIHSVIRTGDRPPDLDEIWRNFNYRLSRLFLRNANDSSSSDNKNIKMLIIGILISVVITLYIGSGLFIVLHGQTGIVVRLGRYIDTVGYGVHWRLPYPLGWHKVIDTTQVHIIEISRNNLAQFANANDSLILTHDSAIVDISFAVKYRIYSAMDYLLHSSKPEKIISQSAKSAIREIVGTRDKDEIFSQDLSILQKQLIDIVQQDIDRYQAGIKITNVVVHYISVPHQLKAEKINIKNAMDVRETSKESAQVYANKLLPKAKCEAMKMIDDANSYVANIISHANADAERFNQVYKQYLKAPEIIREKMYLDTMREIYSNSTKIYVDNKGILYLAIDKFMEQVKKNSTRNDITSSELPSNISNSISSKKGRSVTSSTDDVSINKIGDNSAVISWSRLLRDRLRDRSSRTDLL